jgi:hypothetical protein
MSAKPSRSGRLAQVTLAVCAVQVERVLERAVDALGVAASRIRRAKSGEERGMARRFLVLAEPGSLSSSIHGE